MKQTTLSGNDMPKQSFFLKLFKTNKKKTIEIISGLLILLFLYTSTSKFIDFERSIREMNDQPFPDAITPLLVWAVPLVEIGISLTLMFEKTRKVGLWASLILMSLFTVYTATVLLHFFRYVPCSCGGVIKQLSWTQHMFFNLFFVGVSLAGIILMKNQRTANNL